MFGSGSVSWEGAFGAVNMVALAGWLALVAAPQLRTAESVRPIAELLGRELGWDEERVAAEAGSWPEAMAAEGCDPAGAVAA